MLRKRIYLLIIVPVLAVLAACSSLNLPGAASTTGQAQAASGSSSASANPAGEPVESKLAVGTLKLEGTSNAVTAEQAKTLLPLWKAVKNLSASSSASAAEMTALYQQIQDAMTAQQVQAIKDMTLDQTAMQDLMKQYNVQMPVMPTPNATQMARRSSGSTASGSAAANAQGAGGAMMPPDGMPPDGGFGGSSGANGGSTGSGSTSVRPQGTPLAGMARGGMPGGVNQVFVDPLITLLEAK